MTDKRSVFGPCDHEQCCYSDRCVLTEFWTTATVIQCGTVVCCLQSLLLFSQVCWHFDSMQPVCKQVAQPSQRDRAAGSVSLVLAKSGKDWNWETIFYGHYRSIFNHCDIIGQQSNSVKKTQNTGRSRSFKVIEVGINRKHVCDFLLVINSNWHPISYCFGVIAAYCSSFWQFAFFEPPFGSLKRMKTVASSSKKYKKSTNI